MEVNQTLEKLDGIVVLVCVGLVVRTHTESQRRIR